MEFNNDLDNFYKIDENSNISNKLETEDIIKLVSEKIKAEFGVEYLQTPQSFIGMNIGVISYFIEEILNRIPATFNNRFNLFLSHGNNLDDLATLFLTSRQPATASKCLCKVYGVKNTIIPVGLKAQDENNNIWITKSAGIINDNGFCEIDFYCLTEGKISCDVGKLNSLVDYLAGIESIINEVSAIVGTDIEDDTSFANKTMNSMYNNVGYYKNIQRELMNLNYMYSINVLDNPKNESVTINGVTIPPHSLYIAVLSDNSNDEIAEVLGKCKIPGANTYGNTIISGREPVFQNYYEYNIERVAKSKINIAISLINNSGLSTDDIIQQIKDFLINNKYSYINNTIKLCDIGKPFTIFNLIPLLKNKFENLSFYSIKIKKIDDSEYVDALSFYNNEIVDYDEETILIDVRDEYGN